MRTYTRIVAMLGLAAFCSYAAGQPVAAGSVASANFTFTDFVTRVPVSPPNYTAIGIAGPNFICNGFAGPDQTEKFPATHYPGDLRGSLFKNVYGKSLADLIHLRDAVQNVTGRDAKVRELFGINQLSSSSTAVYTYAIKDAQRRLLQMGQEVSDLALTDSSVLANAQRCYTTLQVNQAINEGMRVVNEIIQVMQKN